MNTVPSQSNGRQRLTANLNSPSAVSLNAFLQEVCASFDRRCKDLKVVCSIDVAPEIPLPEEAPAMTHVLSLMIEDALSAMPGGGQLDLIGMVNVNGYEIEISDSGDRHQHGLVEEPTAIWTKGQTLALAAGMELDAVRCPQGGLARTLFIPRQAVRAAA